MRAALRLDKLEDRHARVLDHLAAPPRPRHARRARAPLQPLQRAARLEPLERERHVKVGRRQREARRVRAEQLERAAGERGARHRRDAAQRGTLRLQRRAGRQHQLAEAHHLRVEQRVALAERNGGRAPIDGVQQPGCGPAARRRTRCCAAAVASARRKVHDEPAVLAGCFCATLRRLLPPLLLWCLSQLWQQILDEALRRLEAVLLRLQHLAVG